MVTTQLTRMIMSLPWDEIEDASDESGIPENVIAAIILTESAGDRFACRFEKDYRWTYKTKELAQDARITETTELMLQMTSFGLMQIMGAVARELGLKGSILQLTDIKTNLKFACLLLKRLAKKYKERSDVFAAYNAGSPIKTLDGKYKNQGYVDKVLDHLAAIEAVRGA